MSELYANVVYQKLKKANGKEEISNILEKYFRLTKQMEKYDETYIGVKNYRRLYYYIPLIKESVAALKQKAFLEKNSAEDFYNCLWAGINNDYIFSDEDSKIFALWLIARMKQLPFYRMDCSPLQIDEKDFKKLIKKNKNVLDRITYLQGIHFSQRTEEASLVLNEILSLDKFEDQTIAFLFAMRMLFRKEQRRQQLKELQKK